MYENRQTVMTLQEWTTNPTAVEKAAALQKGETYREMMEVMRDEMPLTRIPLPFGSPPTDYVYAHGFQKGYEYAVKLLKALGQPQSELPPEPEATFSNTNNL